MPANGDRKMSLLDRMARKAVLRLLGSIADGQICLVEAGRTERFGDAAGPGDLQVTVTVHTPRAYRSVLLGGSIGAAEAYVEGLWSCSDLTALLRVFARNYGVLISLDRGWARLAQLLHAARHRLRANTRRGSRQNIAAHYDLSNDFFSLFLDETLTYSCAVFEEEGMSLADASRAKLDRVCRKLALTGEDHLLEIGSGWGSLALHAAEHFGCRVTTTTISREQYELATRRVWEAGLDDRISVLQQDYRDLEGTYSKIASIEMIEAVGWQNLRRFFRKCSQLLTPNGAMVLQAITMIDQDFERYKNSVDFINRYIFPGGCIPSVTAMLNAVTQATDMRMLHLEDITSHYAETLRRWRSGFLGNLEHIREMGFDERFVRMWGYYLAFCEGGFEERVIGDVQIVLAKPGWRGAAPLGRLSEV